VSYVTHAGLDATSCLTEARLTAWLTVEQCMELCDVSQRTWYRWMARGAPRWAIRLILSQQGSLDRFGWKHWEIRRGCLYNLQLSHRYHWTPVNLLMPLYGFTDSGAGWSHLADNVSSIEAASRARNQPQSLQNTANPLSAKESTTAYNIYYVK